MRVVSVSALGSRLAARSRSPHERWNLTPSTQTPGRPPTPGPESPGWRYLDAARAVLEEAGSGAVTMRAVADVAGTSATAIYRFFPDKEALLDAVYGELFEDFRQRIQSAANREAPSARDRLLAAMDAYRDFGLQNPEGYSLLFLEPDPARRSQYPDDFRPPRSSTFRLLVEGLESCIAEKSVRVGDPVEIALVLDAQLIGLMVLFRSGRFGDDVGEFSRVYRAALERVLA